MPRLLQVRHVQHAPIQAGDARARSGVERRHHAAGVLDLGFGRGEGAVDGGDLVRMDGHDPAEALAPGPPGLGI